MAQAPGLNLIPLEAFQVGPGQSFGFTVVSSSSGTDFQVQNLNETYHFRTPGQAHERMEALRKGYSLLGIKEIPIHVAHPSAKTPPAPPHAKPKHATESRPAQRAVQQAPPRTEASKPGPSPQKGAEPKPADRAVAAPTASAAKPVAAHPAQATAPRPSAKDRALDSQMKLLRPDRPLELMSDAAAGYFIADTIGSIPVLMGLASVVSLNPIGLYAAYKMSQILDPIQKSIDEDAAERLHRAEGTAPDWFVSGGTFVMSLIPQLIGGPEEEGAMAAKELGQVGETAARFALKESEVVLSRFNVAKLEEPIVNKLGEVRGFCFAPGTLVNTPIGAVPIESINAGDRVVSWDRQTRRCAVGIVTRRFEGDSQAFVRVCAGGSVIASTPGHPFWTPDRRWVPAQALRARDTIFSGVYGPVAIDEVQSVQQPATTYNIEVAGFHNYLVSELGLLVHNISAIGDTLKAASQSVKGAVLATTKRIAVGKISTPRGSGQRAIMGRSASELKAGSVWAHVKGLVLGGVQSRENLVAASMGSNRTMIPFEMGLAAAARAGRTVEIEVTAYGAKGVASHFEFNAWIDGVQVLETTLAGDVVNPAREEMSFWMRGMPMALFKK